MTLHQTLLHHHYVLVPPTSVNQPAWNDSVATVVSNMMYYHVLPHQDVVDALSQLSGMELLTWWSTWEPVFKSHMGADKSYRSAMVYRNFPLEVLSSEESSAARNRLGSAWSYMQTPMEARNPLEVNEDVVAMHVVHLSQEDTISNVLDGYWTSAKSWSVNDIPRVQSLYDGRIIDVQNMRHKENAWTMVGLLKETWGSQWMSHVAVHTATDVARLAQALSGGSLKDVLRFKKWTRAERKAWVTMLNGMHHLEDDVARHPGLFKKFFGGLHVHEYKGVDHLHQVAKKLCDGSLQSFDACVEHAFEQNDKAVVLDLLSKRPGVFMRMLNRVVASFGDDGVTSFVNIVSHLNVRQKLETIKYLETLEDRTVRTVAPKGQWMKLQILPKSSHVWDVDMKNRILSALSASIHQNLMEKNPLGFNLHDVEALKNVILKSNGQEDGQYGRGTRMALPDNVECIRTATFWTHPTTVYCDNGWSFLDEGFNILGTCCWNEERGMYPAAIFSGDAVSGLNNRGEACQMIDLYLEPLRTKGVRYALWTVFSYSGIPFDDLSLTATLQYATDGSLGDVYEPSRVALHFPVKGTDMSRYVLLLDLEKREWIYLDARLKADTGSLGSQYSKSIVQKELPAYMEYLKTLPSVYDLMKHAPAGIIDVHCTDEGVSDISETAVVCYPRNPELCYQRLEIESLL